MIAFIFVDPQLITKADLRSIQSWRPRTKVYLLARVSDLTRVTTELEVSHDCILSRPIKSSSLHGILSAVERRSVTPSPKPKSGIDRKLAEVRLTTSCIDAVFSSYHAQSFLSFIEKPFKNFVGRRQQNKRSGREENTPKIRVSVSVFCFVLQ